MAHPELAQTIYSTRRASFEAANGDQKYFDNRVFRDPDHQETDYDSELPTYREKSVSAIIWEMIKTKPDIVIADLGCGPNGQAIRQGIIELFPSTRWIGINAKINRLARTFDVQYIDASRYTDTDSTDVMRTNTLEQINKTLQNTKVTIISGDVQYAPELLKGVQADVILLNKILPYLGDPWGLMAQISSITHEGSYVFANDIPLDAVIPELTDEFKQQRFIAYCQNALGMEFHLSELYFHDHLTDIAWKIQQASQIPLLYLPYTVDVPYEWGNPDKVGVWIDPFIITKSMTYKVLWNLIEKSHS
jgi:hypothetical protein